MYARMTGAAFGAGLRIGDVERSAAVEKLNQHYAAGRLTRIEHDERVDFALAARTQADLLVLFADLPDLDAPKPEHRRGFRGGVPILGALIVALVLTLAVSSFIMLIKALPVVFVVLFAVLAFRALRRGRRHRSHW